MSIEAKLEALTVALERNSDLLEGMTAKAKAATSGKAATTEDDDKPKATRKPAAGKTKVPTAKEIAAATTAFLEVEDQETYDERKAIIKKIVGKFDAAKMSEIADEDRTEAMALLQIAIDGGNPFKKARRDEDEDMA